MMSRYNLAALALFSAYVLVACAKQSPEAPTEASNDGQAAVAADTAQDARATDVEWLKHGLDDGENRFSTLSDISDENVGDLGLAWFYDYPTNRGMEATPLIIDGVMYTTSSWSLVYAHDAVTGELLWFYDPQVPPDWAVHLCCDVVNRGVAYQDGHLFFGTIDGRLISLNAEDGSLRWDIQTTDRSSPSSP